MPTGVVISGIITSSCCRTAIRRCAGRPTSSAADAARRRTRRPTVRCRPGRWVVVSFGELRSEQISVPRSARQVWSTMIGPRPIAPAQWLIACVAAVLPSDVRVAIGRNSLPSLGRAAQLAQSGRLLVGALSLRKAVTDRDPPRIGDRPCRLALPDRPTSLCRAAGRQSGNAWASPCALHPVRQAKDPPSYGVMPPTALGGRWWIGVGDRPPPHPERRSGVRQQRKASD
jgi:hypothetical protein